MHTCPGVNDRKIIHNRQEKNPPIHRESAGNTMDHSNYCTV